MAIEPNKKMIKIHSLNKVIYLTDNQANFKSSSSNIIESISSASSLKKQYDRLIQQNDLNEIFFYNTDLELLLNYFSSMFRIIEAAGGLVKNQKGEWLFIFRHGKWDLPKGKIEKNESIETAAIREVEEECGISSLSIIKKLPSTYHTYYLEERPILKRTYWFEMNCTDTSPLIPQLEEGITDVKWLKTTSLEKVYTNTYSSIAEVLTALN